jgi:hypothetical protein
MIIENQLDRRKRRLETKKEEKNVIEELESLGKDLEQQEMQLIFTQVIH